MRWATKIPTCTLGIVVFALAPLLYSQAPPRSQNPQVAIGDNTRLSAGGLFSAGYSGHYGDFTQSDHGLTWGFDGDINGYYYNPNFLSFNVTPYYNQSRLNSSFQSLTGATGVTSTVNLFSGSHFPGSVNYHFDRNTSGSFGLTAEPNFTTIGRNQGFGVSWAALIPGLPTLSVGYSQGDGSGTIFGTDEKTSSNNKILNVHSNYSIAGFDLNAFYDRNQLNSEFPQFLSGAQASVQDSTGHDVGVGAQHRLPLNGQFFTNFTRSSADTRYFSPEAQTSNVSSYTDDIISSGASFHPTQKLSLNLAQNYTSNLNGYLAQSLGGSGAPVVGVNLGTGSHSSTFGGGATYQFTNYLSASGQATYYNQYYFGHNYTGEYISGTVNYGKRLWDMLSFSGSVIDSNNGQGNNALGFVGNVNFFHKFQGWRVTGLFSYAQNVQSILVTYTTSYYSYSGNVHRRLPWMGLQWTAAFNGTHSGLTNFQGTSSHSEGYSTSIGSRKFSLTGDYTSSTGISLLGAGGLVPVSGTPGVSDFITFGGTSYGGGFSVTPMRRLVVSGSYNRAISNTIGETFSHNNTAIYNAQLQYHLRRIGLQAGYTRFDQGISAVGAPASNTAYFAGITRWFDFF